MDRKLLFRQILALLLVIALFLGFNGSLYLLLTRRLKNNFSEGAQPKMVDVGRYLPFEANSDLPHMDTDFHLDGDLPVLDGAAALVPVYAAVIDAVYPEGSVTYEGGVFSDDNYYGENFAPDSKMQYRNTVRGYKAIVDGDADILFSAAPSAEQKQYAADQGVELVLVEVSVRKRIQELRYIFSFREFLRERAQSRRPDAYDLFRIYGRDQLCLEFPVLIVPEGEQFFPYVVDDHYL